MRFQRHTYNCIRGFSVPSHIYQTLKLRSRNRNVFVIIKHQANSTRDYRGPARLTSGPEIRSGAAVKNLRRHEPINVFIRPL